MGFSCLAPGAGVAWIRAAPWTRAVTLEAALRGRRLAKRSIDLVDAMIEARNGRQGYRIEIRDGLFEL